jgi:ribosomal protein L13E
VYENYLKRKQVEWKETTKDKKKKKTGRGLFSLGWLYQPGLEVVARGLGLAPPLVSVGTTNRD